MIKLLYLRNKKGSLLILCYIVIVSFAILSGAFLLKSVTEKNIAQRERNWLQAFQMSQAAVMRAFDELRNNYDWPGTATDVNLVLGEYRVSVASVSDKRRITAQGFVPNSASASVQRSIEVFVQKEGMPANFFNNALYVSGDVTLNGSAYEINGDILHSGALNDNTNVNGSTTQDTSIAPLIALSFADLRQIAEAQIKADGTNNVYDVVRAAERDYPTSFWFDEPAGIPNVVYVEADLTLNGNIGIIGGFFVVVGDVITNPSGSNDTTINGNGQIEGCIYTTGEFTVNGGGGGLNVSGGVWAGEEATINGNARVDWNQDYMNAISGLGVSTDIQVISWREI